MRRAGGLVLTVVLAGATGCGRSPGGASSSLPYAEARALIEEGQYDEALARLGEETDADACFLLGRAWAGKAGPPATPPVPELRPEEQQALAFYERAVAANPSHAEALRAMGDLLAPHALAALAPPASQGRKGVEPTPPPGGGAVSVDRVLRAYGGALQADLDDTVAVSSLIAFASRAGRLREAEAGYEELVRRDREDADVLVQFGDFLAGPAGKPEAALARYAQALIWRPDDNATRLRMTRIHLDAASGHLERREYPAAEARLREARKFIVDPASPEAARAREIDSALAEVRGRR
jgi:tetratricopeptide (TPR) repeat protein